MKAQKLLETLALVSRRWRFPGERLTCLTTSADCQERLPHIVPFLSFSELPPDSPRSLGFSADPRVLVLCYSTSESKSAMAHTPEGFPFCILCKLYPFPVLAARCPRGSSGNVITHLCSHFRVQNPPFNSPTRT